ncbi:hypothetical protein BHE74_00031001 [Ensete ventricosum]|nr:hypothetical protein BHE74_00031001 [Ensete ventricosum]
MLRSFFGFITKFHRIFSNTFKAVREEDKDQKKTKGRASSRDSKKDQKKKKKKKKKGRASSRESIALWAPFQGTERNPSTSHPTLQQGSLGHTWAPRCSPIATQRGDSREGRYLNSTQVQCERVRLEVSHSYLIRQMGDWSRRAMDGSRGPSLPSSASGACRGYRELTRMAQGSSLEEDRDSWKIVGGSRKVYRELERFNHDGEKELQTIHEPRIKLRHQTKVWMMWWEFTGSSLGLR